MISGEAILPASSGPFTRALAFAATDELPVPIRDIVNPARTPLAFLPFLAAHESVRLWWDDWPEERKRQIVVDWTRLARLVGTRAAAEAFLAYVDTTIVHKRSYPSRYPVGRIAAGVTPIQFPDFTARFLLKVGLKAHRRAIVVGRTAVGRAALMGVNREPLRRAKAALVASKAPETAYSVTFAHRVPITLDDGLDLAAGHEFGAYRDRTRL